MIGVSVASNKSLQLEATQEAYNRVVIRLNLLLIEDKTHEQAVRAKLFEDKTHEQAVRAKLFEVMGERNKLGKYSTSDLYVMQKSIEKTVDDFLAGLNEQYITA
uniref:hypothetical protein n=1 Tax=Psychrobacter sp. DAB_AL43B TaxID=1028416 RepID=UPI00155DD72D|nr:hypothetical protein [Psychrobacter sp. DAB_AL43B]